jgi:hypothetical protein
MSATGRERVDLVEKFRLDVIGDVAGCERRQRQRDAEPRKGMGRPIADYPDDDRCRRAQAEQPPEVDVVMG